MTAPRSTRRTPRSRARFATATQVIAWLLAQPAFPSIDEDAAGTEHYLALWLHALAHADARKESLRTAKCPHPKWQTVSDPTCWCVAYVVDHLAGEAGFGRHGRAAFLGAVARWARQRDPLQHGVGFASLAGYQRRLERLYEEANTDDGFRFAQASHRRALAVKDAAETIRNDRRRARHVAVNRARVAGLAAGLAVVARVSARLTEAQGTA